MQSLDLSRRQGARAWELRTAIDLAALLAAQRRRERARAILQPVFDAIRRGLGYFRPEGGQTPAGGVGLGSKPIGFDIDVAGDFATMHCSDMSIRGPRCAVA